MTYTYNIHDVVKIESDIMLLNRAFHRYFLSSDVSDPDLIIKIRKNVDFSKKGLSRHDLWFYGKEGKDFVYYEDRILGMKDKVLIKNLENKPTEIHATKSVTRINLRSRGSLSDLIEAVIDLKFLKAGLFTIHAASLSRNNSAILLTGFPNIGKTLSTLHLLKNGFSYLGDDNGVIDRNGNVYCYPSTSSISYHDFLKFIEPVDIGRWNYYKYLLRTFPMQNKIIERLFDYPEIYLPDIKKYKQADKAKAWITCCLEIEKRKIKEVDKEELANKIWLSNNYSRPAITQNPFMYIYAYFNDINFAELDKMEKDILLSFLSNSRCFIISCNDRDWGSVLDDVLQRGRCNEIESDRA